MCRVDRAGRGWKNRVVCMANKKYLQQQLCTLIENPKVLVRQDKSCSLVELPAQEDVGETEL